jgi:hypothetical protein
MPYTVTPSETDTKYFLNRYEGFKKQAEELIEKFSQQGLTYQWVLEHSSFSDPEDYNKLILIGFNKEFGEIRRISCFEKGY